MLFITLQNLNYSSQLISVSTISPKMKIFNNYSVYRFYRYGDNNPDKGENQDRTPQSAFQITSDQYKEDNL